MKIGRYGDFWSHAERTEDCWIWQGGGDVYGRTRANGRQMGAHRRAWELTYGDIPPGLLVLHHCDEPRCVRPDHLWLGTHQDNSDDAKRKGRINRPDHRGSRNPRARTNAEQVAEMRRLYDEGWTQVQLAERFGVKQPQVSRVIRRASWQ